MGGANNMPTGGGNTGFFGGNAPSSGNVGSGKGTSSSQSSYLPQANNQMVGYSNSLQQPSYGPPPSSYYRPQSQQSYGGMGNSKGTSQPAYGGTGYNTPRLPQMVQPQYGNYNVNPTINRAPPGTVYSGPSSTAYPSTPANTVYNNPSSTTYPSAPAPIPGNVYGGPTPTPTEYPSPTTVATPAPENFNAAPTINRAPIVEAPPAPAPTPTPDQTSAPEQAPNPYAAARYDDEGRAYNSQGQQLRWNEDNQSYGLVPYYGEKRGGRIEAKSAETVDRALSLVRNVAKKDKK
jgi:hypothetical protein